MRTWNHLLEEVLEQDNLDAAFDEVVNHLKEPKRKYRIFYRIDDNGNRKKEFEPIQRNNISRKNRIRASRNVIISSVKSRIENGTFCIETYREFYIKENEKVRLIQSPTVEDRVGVNAIIRVLERHIYPTIVSTSAASIKGRGVHKLYRKMRSDVRHDREGTMFFYKCDIKKFYQNVNHGIMKSVLHSYVTDKRLLPMLDGFIDLLSVGISIGLRSSQFYGNLLLRHLDHRMKESEHCRYYYRYCDDIVVLGNDKKRLWHWRNVIHDEIETLGLSIKPDEAVRPISDGIDFLGYVDNGDYSRIRKRTKQNAARKLHRIKSRKRRQELIGSLNGMLKWGDCGKLYKTLVGDNMKEFKDLHTEYRNGDGKKMFDGAEVSLRNLVNLHITILDFEEKVNTRNGDRTLVHFQFDDGRKGKYFTNDKKQLSDLKQLSEQGEIPFGTIIGTETFGNGKIRYRFT